MAYYNDRNYAADFIAEFASDLTKGRYRGSLPLHTACAGGDLKLVKHLLKQGIAINARDSVTESTPLHVAILFKHKHIFKYLIDNGADVSASDIFGTSVLFQTCLNFDIPFIDYLIDKGADVNLKHPNSTDSLLHLASSNSKDELVDYLIRKGVSVNYVNKYNSRPLHLACRNGAYGIVKKLVQNSSDFEAGCTLISDDEGEMLDKNASPLYISAKHGHLDLVKFFIKLKVDVNTKTWRGITPLHAVCIKGFTDIAKLLIKHHADVNARYLDNETPLHLATYFNYMELVAVLLESPNIDVNAESNSKTALHIAAFYQHLDILKLLVENGADVNLCRNDPKTFTLASNHVSDNMFRAIIKNDIDKLEIAIKQGADVNAKNKKYKSPIILASYKGFCNIVQCLVQNKAEVNTTDKDNCSALHYAAKFDNLDVVHYLLQHGAIYNIPTAKENKTPCDFARQGSPVFDLFKLIDRLFYNVTKGNVLEELREIKRNNINDFNSIVKACNVDGKTLIQLNDDLLKKHKDIAESFAKLLV